MMSDEDFETVDIRALDDVELDDVVGGSDVLVPLRKTPN